MSKVELTAAQKAREFTRTHFSLGDYTYNGFGTEMKGKYQKHNENGENNGRSRLTQQKNNFKLGNLDNQFKTSSSKHYCEKKEKVENGLPKWKLEDLKTHHINYGEYGNQQRTEQQVKYDVKQQDNSEQYQERQMQQQRMRRHHHDFKEDNHPRYLSQYQQSNQLDEQQQQQSMQDHQQLAKHQHLKATTKTNSNILLGQHYLPAESQQQADYLHQPPAPTKQWTNYTKTNYNLGEQRGDFSTTNHQYYPPQPLDKQPTQDIQQLAQSNFTLGADQRLPPVSEQQQQYREDNHSRVQPPKQAANQQYTNHFQLGNDHPVFSTHYSHHMHDYSMCNQQRPSAKRSSTLTVGTAPLLYKSHNTQHYHYDKHSLIPNNITPQQKQELYISHLKFNDIHNNKYSTNQHSHYVTHNQPPNKLSPSQLANLKGTHFDLGGHSSKLESTNQKTYQKHDNSEARGEQKQSNKSNWKLG